MRILILSNLFPPEVVGGYERLCGEVSGALAERGHEVYVLAGALRGADPTGSWQEVGSSGGGSRLRIRRGLRLLAGNTIYEPFPGNAAERDAVNRANIAALDGATREVRPDVVFSWNLFFLDRGFLRALGNCGAPIAVMLTDNWLLVMERPDYVARLFREHVFGSSPFPLHPKCRPWRRLLDKLLGSAAAGAGEPTLERLPFAAVFGSEFVDAMHADAGVAFAASEVVHNGVRTLPGGRGGTSRGEPLAGPKRLLFAGRLVDLKGAHDAVAALPLLLGEGGDYRLTILGDAQDAAYAHSLEEAIRASGCADRIETRPPVPEASLARVFDDHDIYLFPSLYEPFSLTLIHALGCGIPTVASDAGGNPEIVRDGETGLLYSKGSAQGMAAAVRRLAGDPALRARLSEGGRREATHFTFERMVTGMECVLGRLAAP